MHRKTLDVFKSRISGNVLVFTSISETSIFTSSPSRGSQFESVFSCHWKERVPSSETIAPIEMVVEKLGAELELGTTGSVCEIG